MGNRRPVFRFPLALLALGCLVVAGALLVGPRNAHAQQEEEGGTRSISGNVVSGDTGDPLPGVNVVAPGTQVGTATNAEGDYALEGVPAGADSLQFSFIGYQTQSVAIEGRSVVNVALNPEAAELGEVVVIGYGERQSELLTESVESVDAESIDQMAVTSPEQALQGRMSGVQVTPAGGGPGSGTAIRIRGVGTVGNTQPLFVIDGVPVGRNSGSGAGFDSINPLATLNPSDIESISVLKDASAAAVYGVRAANGVVLIETKEGQGGDPSITFDSYYGVQAQPDLWEFNNTQQWLAVTREAYQNTNEQLGYTPDDADYYELNPDLAAEDSELRGINTNWLDAVRNPNEVLGGAPQQKYNISVSGAAEDLNYYISGGYFNQESVAGKHELDRYNFRINSDYQVTDWLNFGETLSITHHDVQAGRNSRDLFEAVARIPPFFEVYDTDNSVVNNRYGFEGNKGPTGTEPRAGVTIHNSFAESQLSDFEREETRLLGGLNLRFDVLDSDMGNVFLKSDAQIDYTLGQNNRFRPPFTNAEVGLDRPAEDYQTGKYTEATQVFTNTLNYDGDLGDHSVEVLGGFEYQTIYSDYVGVGGTGLLSFAPSFRSPQAITESIQLTGSGGSESDFVGIIGRVTYDYLDRYLLTASLRRDGTSNFSPEDDRNWGTFPSVSVGWRLGEEPFMEAVPAVSGLKLRGSWGQLGNDQTVSYPHISQVSTIPNYGVGEETTNAAVPSNFVNPDVTWETVETLDFGVESSFFDDRLNFGATYYRRITRDFLIQVPISNVTGFGGAPTNVGSVRNMGVELSSSYFDQFGDVNLELSANLTTVDNELTALTTGTEEFSSGGGYRTAVGFPISYFWGYKTDGLYQSEEEAAGALPDTRRTPGEEAQPGDVKFVDVDGDDEITPDDRTFLGSSIPDFYYGFSVDASWRAFDLALLFQGQGGVQAYNQFRRQYLGAASSGSGNALAESLDRWTPQNTDTGVPRLAADDTNANYRFSDKWVEDAGYLRLRNVQLGYSIPPSVASGAFERARVYFGVSNVFTITGYSGLDPVVQSGVSDQLGAGTDRGGIPATRTYRLGVQLTF